MRKAWLLWSKPPIVGHAGVERVFAGVAEGRVPEVMAERDRLGKIVVESQGAGDRASDLRDLDRMGEPGAGMIALVIDEDLGLVGEAAERGRMDDPVAVALELRPRRRRRLGHETPGSASGIRRIGRPRLPRLIRHRLISRVALSAGVHILVGQSLEGACSQAP